MANNSPAFQVQFSKWHVRDNVIFLHILVVVFFSINVLLIATFFRKECFYTSMRYTLFAVTLLSDSMLLLLSYILLILNNLKIQIQTNICTVLCFMLSLYFTVTAVTLTAMVLERYVAICIPLHHAQLCSTHRILHVILIIHAICVIRCIVFFSAFFASVSLSFYTQVKSCSIEMFTIYTWHDHVRSAVSQFYFLVMCIIIVFCYVKIMKVAKAASEEDKKATQKGLRTVILHAFQLFLCLMQLWCPLIENAILQFDIMIYIDVRFFNYVLFGITPRCLSPLIYGLRDETFFLALKSYSVFDLLKRIVIRHRNAH